jgi:hypothetical protein
MPDERELNLRVTEDASQAIAENEKLAESQRVSTAAQGAELEVVSARTKIGGVLASQLDAETLAKMGLVLATKEEGAAENAGTAAKGLGAAGTRELSNAENLLTFSRGRAIRAAIDEAITTLGVRDAAMAAAPAVAGVAVAGFAFNAVLDAMKSRGVDVSTFMDGFRGILDRLSVSLGGVGTEGAKFNTAVADSTIKMAGAGEAAGVYANAQARLVAAGIDVAKVTDQIAASIALEYKQVDVASLAVTGFEAVQEKSATAGELAAAALDKLNLGLNKIAAFDPDLVAKITDYIKRMGETGGMTADRIEALTEKIAADRLALEQWASKMKEMGDIGIAIVRGTEEWVKEYDLLKIHTDELKAAGASKNEVDVTTAKETEKVTATAAALRGVLSLLPADVQKNITEWLALHPVLQKSTQELTKLRDEIEKGKKSLEDHTAALAKDLEEIDKKAASAIAKAQQESAAEIKSIGDTLVAADVAHAKGLMSDQAYNAAVDKLVADRNKIESDSAVVIKKAVDDAASARVEAEKKAQDAMAGTAKHMLELMGKQGDLNKQAGEVAAGQVKIAEAMEREHNATVSAGEPMKTLLADIKNGKQDVADIAGHHRTAATNTTAHATAAGTLHPQLKTVNEVLGPLNKTLGETGTKGGEAAAGVGALHGSISAVISSAPEAIGHIDNMTEAVHRLSGGLGEAALLLQELSGVAGTGGRSSGGGGQELQGPTQSGAPL